MSQRPSIYVSRRLRTPPRPSPNNCVPWVTTEIRIFAPASTPTGVLGYELWAAVESVTPQMIGWPGPKTTPLTVESDLRAYGLSVPREWRASGLAHPEPER